MIDITTSGAVRTLRLCHGKASALDLEFLHALDAEFLRALAAPERAVVLTGTGSIFSAGVDLLRLVREGAPYAAQFAPALVHTLTALFAFERPLVVAVNGHAIAGGAIFTWVGDYRLLARGRATLGVPEHEVGVPFPAIAVEIARHAVPRQHLQRLLYLGERFDTEQSLALGLVDELVEPDQLLPRAQAVAERLAALPSENFALTKRAVRGPVLARLATHARAHVQELTRAWSSAETLAAIEAYVQRTLR